MSENKNSYFSKICLQTFTWPGEVNWWYKIIPLSSYVRKVRETFKEDTPSYPLSLAYEPWVKNVTGIMGGSGQL